MTYVNTQPDLMAAAAADLAEIRSAIGAANRAAAAPTAGVVAAASDEVSVACATLFNTYAREYQAIMGRMSAFHDEFTQVLAACGLAYAETEVANAAAAARGALDSINSSIRGLLGLGTAASDGVSAVAGITTPTLNALADPPGNVVTLVMGASGYPLPWQQYINGVPPLYINPFYPNGTPVGLLIPAGLYPLTGPNGLTFDASVSQGVTILNNAIQSAIVSGKLTINVFGYSQSAVSASLEMRALNPTNTPGGSLLPNGVSLNFTLVGDPSNPNGGLLTRFPGLSFPSLGLTFGAATPDNSFPTRIYSIEYDGLADFPQYPIDVVSDLNAVFGAMYLHSTYPLLTPDQINSAIPLTNTPGPTLTNYFIIPTQNLPLLDPVRAIPVIGNPIADLLQPDLRVLVDLGYGSTTQGWSSGPPNVPTPFGVLPPVSRSAVFAALAAGTQQGIGAFANDISAEVSSLSNLSLSSLTPVIGPAVTGAIAGGSSLLLAGLTSALSSPAGFINALQLAGTHVADTIANVTSTAHATVFSTATAASALINSVPPYDSQLFHDGREQMRSGDTVGGLVYALGAPAAVDIALLTLFGGFEVTVFQHAAASIVSDIGGQL